MTLIILKRKLRSYASPKRKKINEWFFKTGKGHYGHGDVFIGVSNPDCRKVAKQFQYIAFPEVKKLLQSKIHEDRFTALLILVNKFEAGDDHEKREVYKFYLKHLEFVNNWDLVDTSAYKIVGAYIVKHPQEGQKLSRYALSKNLWERRLSIVATFALIRKGEFAWTMKNAKALLVDSHDLTHKAVGWMLREVWKRDHALAESFLIKNYSSIPRTTLRYAIERMKKGKRKQFLKGF